MTLNPVAVLTRRLPLLAAACVCGLLPLVVQAADLPANAELQYVGPYGVPATMTFARSGNSYRVLARINAPLYQMRFESVGSVSGNTLRPASYTDTRKGKLYAQAKFGSGQISYGRAGEQVQTAAAKGPTFDLFTLAWQLAANNGQLPAGLQITNGKKLYPVSGMRKVGSGQYRIGGGETRIERYRVQRGDDTIEYAFAPDLHNIPAQISYTDDGKTYTLKLKSVRINGQVLQPK